MHADVKFSEIIRTLQCVATFFVHTYGSVHINETMYTVCD